MASVPSCISSSISERFSENSIDQQIKHFFALSQNLTLQEKAEGGKEYQLLNKFFIEGFEINESDFIQGISFANQSWPVIQRGETRICFLGNTLLDYLKGIESHLERNWDSENIALEQIDEIESYLPSSNVPFELCEPSSLMTRVVRIIKPEKGSAPQPKIYSYYVSAERSSEFLSTEFATFPPLKGVFFNDVSSVSHKERRSSLNSFSQLNSRNSDQEEL